jgi:hypothetical protein
LVTLNKTGQAVKETEVTLYLDVAPMDADAYYVQPKKELNDFELKKLKLAWAQMNAELPKAARLFVIPEDFEWKPVPSSVLTNWIEQMQSILKERGEL